MCLRTFKEITYCEKKSHCSKVRLNSNKPTNFEKKNEKRYIWDQVHALLKKIVPYDDF